MNTKGILIDYGGTLDSNGVHWVHIIREAYREAQVAVTETHFREAYVYAERYLASNPAIQPHFTFKELMETKIAVELDYLQKNGAIAKCSQTTILNIAHICYEKAKETTGQSAKTLQKLSEKYELSLVSNFYGNIDAVLSDFGLKRYFPKIIESSVVGIRKPDPQIFQLGIEALNLKAEETIAIGDSYTKDIVPAKHCGCRTIWIKGKGWKAETENHAADFTFCQFKDIESILL